MACCLTEANRHVPLEVLRLVESFPVSSLTFSRLLPIGHGRGFGGLVESDYEALYQELKRTVVTHASIPVRLVGLLDAPRCADCPAGRQLIGLMPDGRLVPCVLMPPAPYAIPHPLAVGVPAAVARLQMACAGTRPPFCWEKS